MSLFVIPTAEERLVGAPVIEALRDGVERAGSAVLLVPSFAQALDAQRTLAAERGLALAVTTTTPAAWVGERWEVWGDGRALVGGAELSVLAREALATAAPEERGPIEPSVGVAEVLANLVGSAAPWLPLDADGSVCEDACKRAGLTEAETRLVGIAGSVRSLLAERGLVSRAEASALVPGLLHDAGACVPPVVVAGYTAMGRADRELARALGAITSVTVVVPTCEGAASSQARSLIAWLSDEAGAHVIAARCSHAPVARAEELSQLLASLFGEVETSVEPTGAVELLLPAGPVAEAELVARHVELLVRREGYGRVVVAVTDMARARRELVPKLAARGLPVRFVSSTALLDCPAAQAFFGYARTVAHLAELAATWPGPVEGVDGPVPQLGDMSWWPPRELSDFLLSDIAHVETARAWGADAFWRGNRLLTPARLLEMLQSERDTSAPVARATAELLRGRMGTAASKLLAPFVEGMGEAIGPLGEHGSSLSGERADEARAVLQAILQLAGTLRELGITADPTVTGSVTLSELVEMAAWAAQYVTVRQRAQSGPVDGGPLVTLMGHGEASRLASGSVDALVACGLTSAERSIAAGDDLLRALLEQLGIEPKADPMASARTEFRALVAVPRHRLVLERALHDADSRVTYPSAMLSELLASYGIPASAKYGHITLPKDTRPETDLAPNLATRGGRAPAGLPCDPAPAGRLTRASQACVFVPQDGRLPLPGDRPVLSASQVETYLDCPYKWFSLRRLRLGTVDAGHGGMEMGTFAHRVLEVTHRELLARALEAQTPGVTRDELLAEVEAGPARCTARSRIGEGNLDEAREVLDAEFTRHQQHMYMAKRPRGNLQLLVAHDSSERAQEDQLREDLHSSLAYQTRILQGFEPRLFEWGFGRRGDLVEYAGAYFTGTVDRIDVSPHGTAVIIDYKHKSPAGFAAEYDALQDGVLEGERLPNRVQSLIYAQVVRRAFEGQLNLVGSVYLSTRSPHALAGVADDNIVDLVFGRISSQRRPRVGVPRAEGGGSGMDALLDRTEELVAEQVRQMLAGNVEARPRDVRSCEFCPVMQCERRVAR